MAPLSGMLGSAVYMTAGTTLIVGLSEWSLDVGNTNVEVTSFGDTWQKFIASVRTYTGSISGNADSDASQATLRSAWLGGSAVALRLYDSATTYYNIGTAYPNGMSPSISQTGKGDISFDFQGSGPLTYV